MFQNRPALRFVLLYTAGILLAAWIQVPPAWCFLLTLLFMFLSGILFWLKKQQFIAVVLLQCSIVLLGFLFQTLQKSDFLTHVLTPRFDGESVSLFGTIDSEPIRREKRINCIVRTDSIFRKPSVERGSRRVVVTFRLGKDENLPNEMEFGKKVELYGLLEPFPFQRNPGEFDYGKYLALNDVQGVVSVKGTCNVQVKESSGTQTLRQWIYIIQRSLYRIIDRLHTPRYASFLKGIIFGYYTDMPSDVKQSFIDTGTIHILAVSGSNVAFVAFMFFAVFGFLRMSRKAVVCAVLLALIAYMLITGESPSVVRATIMAIVILFGTMLERTADIYNSLSVAAIILLLWNTNMLFDVGFQLSFSAVCSLVYCYPRLEFLIMKIPERIRGVKPVEIVLKLFAVSLAAQIGTIPFTAYYFGRVSIISLIANVLVVPISGLNTFIGFTEVLFYWVSPWIAGLYASANDFFIWFLLGFVKQAASVSFAYVETWYVPPILVIGYYTAVFGAFNFNRARVRAWMLILLLIVGNIVIFLDVWTRTHVELSVTVIDVGQGDAVLLECSNGRRMLVDAGLHKMRFDAGERTVVPFLKRKGITALDILLITHPHNDHIGGVCSILRSIQVDTLMLVSSVSEHRQVRDVLQAANECQVGVKMVCAGDQIQLDPGTRVYILFPLPNHDTGRNLNNSSIVMKILFGRTSLLLTGDAETEVERILISKYSTFLSSTILKVGHHGSFAGTSKEFLENVHPQITLISVGNNNAFRHPSPFTIKRMRAHSIKVERTDKSGAIVLESDGARWIKTQWK